jgi:hypothetical protein
MIIRTRYRDIPWSEARKCVNSHSSEDIWESQRGQPLNIIAPPPPLKADAATMCAGPFYPLASQPQNGVCPHIVEIGD